MRSLSMRNCVISACSVSCLLVVVIAILLLMFFNSVFTNQHNLTKKLGFLDGLVSVFTAKSTQTSHLSSKDKEIQVVIGLVSDSENDSEYLRFAFDEFKSRGISNVIHLGDITQLGVPSDLAIAKSIFSEFGLNVYPIPGDRDLWKSSGLHAFNNEFGVSYRFINIADINLLFIDNSNEFEGIDEPQWQFIMNSLGSADFVFLHNPIFFESILLGHKGMGEYSGSVENQRLKLLEEIRKSSVRAVFAGDQHLFSEGADTVRHTLTHYVIGSINSDRNLERPNVAILTIYTDGDYYVEKVSF